MNMLDLAKSSKWKDVKCALKFHYPKDKNNYEPIFDRMVKSKQRKPKLAGEMIQLHVVGDWESDDKGGIKEMPLENQWYSMATNQYSLSFRSWESLFNIPIEEEVIKHTKKEEILAHFLWEITFYGFEKQTKKVGKMLSLRAKSVMKQLPKPAKE